MRKQLRSVLFALLALVVFSTLWISPVPVAQASTSAVLYVGNADGTEVTGNPFNLKVNTDYVFDAYDVNSTPMYRIDLYLQVSYVSGIFSTVSWEVKTSDASVTYSCTHPDATSMSCTRTGGNSGQGLVAIGAATTTISTISFNSASSRIRALPSGTPTSTQSRSYSISN